MYPAYNKQVEKTSYTEVYRECIAYFLSDIWDVTMFSNILTLFNLTAEHFIGETKIIYVHMTGYRLSSHSNRTDLVDSFWISMNCLTAHFL